MTLFTFWSGSQLSLLNVISILSFAAFHKDLTLVIYTTDKQININPMWSSGEHVFHISKNYNLDILSQVPNIKFVEINSSLNRYQRLKSSIHFADFIRIEKLSEHGGVWIDADIIFLKPINDIIYGIGEKLSVIEYSNVITTGFIASKNSEIKINLLLTEALKIINDDSFRNSYQSLGPNLWTKVFIQNRNIFKSSNFMPIKSFYPYNYKHLNKFYYLPDDGAIDQGVYGVHWYNGNLASKYFIERALVNSIKTKSSLTPFDRVFNELRKLATFNQFIDKLID